MKDLFKSAMRGLWNLTKMGAAAGWRWFQGLSGKGKAITVGVLLVVFVVAGITSDQVEDTQQQAADTSTTSESATATEPTVETTTEEPPPEETEPAQERFVSDQTTDDGCPIEGDKVIVTPDCIDAPWPLTVDEGEVYCAEPSAALLRVPAGQPGGGIYGLNGMADTHFPELPPLEDVWRENPDVEDLYISIHPLSSIALDMCDT